MADTKVTKVKKTFKELQELDGVYGKLLAKSQGFAQTKLAYALKRFVEKNIMKPVGDYNEEFTTLRIDNALTDEKTGELLFVDKAQRTPGSREFKYSKDGLKTVIKGERALTEKWAPKEFDVEPFICKDLKGITLTDEEKEILTGLVI